MVGLRTKPTEAAQKVSGLRVLQPWALAGVGRICELRWLTSSSTSGMPGKDTVFGSARCFVFQDDSVRRLESGVLLESQAFTVGALGGDLYRTECKLRLTLQSDIRCEEKAR